MASPYGIDRYRVVFVDDVGCVSPPLRTFNHLENAQAFAEGKNTRLDQMGLDEYGRWMVEDRTTGKLVK